MRRVILESPYGSTDPMIAERNRRYLRRAMAHSLAKGEAPFASHGLYTQPGVLRDDSPDERALGISAGFAWHVVADAVVVYEDHGVSLGMTECIHHAESLSLDIEYRGIGQEPL